MTSQLVIRIDGYPDEVVIPAQAIGVEVMTMELTADVESPMRFAADVEVVQVAEADVTTIQVTADATTEVTADIEAPQISGDV